MNRRVSDLARRLPAPARLARWWVAVSAADMIASDGSPVFTFDAGWSDGEQCAHFDDESGDNASVTFTGQGAFLRGFDHECPLSPWAREGNDVDPRLLEGLPSSLRPCADELAFTCDGISDITLALWYPAGTDHWAHGPDLDADHDGGVSIFDVIDGTPEAYVTWAGDYYEAEVDCGVVAKIFANDMLTDDDISTLNPECDPAEIRVRLAAVDYPIPAASGSLRRDRGGE